MELQERKFSSTNASLISMIQRFSDILVTFISIYGLYLFEGKVFSYFELVMYLSVLVVFQMIGGITDFYRSWRGVKVSHELLLLSKNWTLSIIFSIGLMSLLNFDNFNFRTYGEWYAISLILLNLSRSLIRLLIGSFRYMGYNLRNVAIAGTLPVGFKLAKSLSQEAWLGFKVLGFYNDTEISQDDFNYLGNFDKLIADAKNGLVERIYIAMPMNEETRLKYLVEGLTDTTCSVMLVPDIFTFNILQGRSEEINGVSVVSLFDTPLSGINMLLKRIEDIILSILILLLISPVLLFISIAVKISSPGPIIFKQIRYGLDCKPIKVWKFRSMTVMENDHTVKQAVKGDARLTSIGGFIRQTSLDELPQFINVLKGDMSIVGPRPHAIVHNEEYRNLIKGYMLRHKVKPGITGLAQIKGWRGETDTLDKMVKRIEFDLEYIRTWSIYLDLKIIFLTIFKGFINKSAY